jgi:hypothetical protein
MSPIFYSILHVVSVFVLTGYTFYAFAAPAETRKKVMIITGIASVTALFAGVGLMHKLGYVWSTWPIVKVVAWFGLSGLAGIGYRKREKAPVLMAVALVLIFAALIAVYTKFAF